MSRKDKTEREKLPGQLESKKLKGGGRLVLVKKASAPGMVYQIVLRLKDSESPLFKDPESYNAADVERMYEGIGTLRDFWAKMDDLAIDSYSPLGDDPMEDYLRGDDILEEGFLDDDPEDLE